VDPLTLFALANGAVAAVKKGCQLYKDIKGAAGDVKAVLKDLDEQFNNNHKDKPATVTQRNAYIEEKNRVIELNKKQGETVGIYQELANYLGDFFDNMNKCIAVIEEEERKNREEIYEGNESLGRRALQLVIMKKQLEQMEVELREMLVYNAPPELGALWTDVSEMMESMGGQQKVLLTRKMREDQRAAERRRARIKHYMEELVWGGMAIFLGLVVVILMTWVSYDRKQRWPELEPTLVKKRQDERRQEHLIWLKAQEERIAKEDQEFSQRQRDFITSQREREANENSSNEDR
jgi:CHASE3 domain sensor protein